MPVTDPIADMIVTLKNCSMVRQEEVRIPGSKIKRELARILKEEGYISNYRWINDNKGGSLLIGLRYLDRRTPAIRGVKRISKPGRRVYVRRDQIPRVQGGLGIAILSTTKGILTDTQARKLGVGGELLCFIW